MKSGVFSALFQCMSKSVTVSQEKHPRYKYRVRFPDGESVKQKWFKKKTGKGGADEFATDKQAELDAKGRAEKSITSEEARAVLSFREAVAKLPGEASKTTLTEAIAFYVQHIESRNKSINCELVAEKLLERLKSEGTSKRHQDTIKQRLKVFLAIYGDWLACDVTSECISEYLSECKLASQTKLHHRKAIHQLFQQAIVLQAASVNPTLSAIRPKVTKDDPEILKPKQVASLLASASDSILPAIAVSFFAGVRRAEIERLNWSEIDLENDEIEIKAKNAKTAQRRFIPISENLKAWLLPYAKDEGLLVPSPYQFRKGCDDAREKAGINEWPHNAGRHSFASYHLAMHEDAGKTAMALGHPDSRLLFSRYRKLVKEKEANTYWSIKPEEVENVTEMKQA